MDFPVVFNFNNLEGSSGFSISGSQSPLAQEETADIAGDVNADGIDDILIGLPGTEASGDEGKAYVLFGSAAGFDEDVPLDSLSGSSGIAISGSGTSALVSRAGDVNGDGIDDFLVGAGSKEVAVVFGRPLSRHGEILIDKAKTLYWQRLHL